MCELVALCYSINLPYKISNNHMITRTVIDYQLGNKVKLDDNPKNDVII